jgi:cyanophycin synthetase
MDASLEPADQSAQGDLMRALAMTGFRYPPGFFFGFAQRCVFVSMTMDAGSDLPDLARRLSCALEPFLVVPPTARASSSVDKQRTPALTLLDALVRCSAGLQEAAGITVLPGAGLVSLKPMGGSSQSQPLALEVAIPSRLPESAAEVLGWLADIANALAAEVERDKLVSAEESSLAALMAELRRKAPSGNNVRHWTRAALDLDIPMRTLPMDVVQFGYGRNARLFLRSASDSMPHVGARLALNKLAAAAILRSAEIPVPRQEPVASSEEAAAAAERIGFPVVVKPIDQSRGDGVTAGIAGEAELLRAYRRAQAMSRAVLVEEHVTGQEYRLLVVNGRLFWAYERIPARIVGDGTSTIAELIEEANRTRRPGPSNGFDLVAILIDDELLQFLADSGRTLETVPSPDEVVRLQHAPSNAGGGEILPVFDIVHPDVARIAERAARLLRLDIAGVDYLTTDITRSWREVGGAIIEVNAEPQISPRSRPDIHGALLEELVPGRGRIPVAIVLGDDGTVEAEVRSMLGRAGIRAGLASPRQISIGSEWLAEGTIDPFRAARALIINSEVEAILLFSDGRQMLRNGLPFERVDILAVAGSAHCELREFLSLARPHIRRGILMLREDPDQEAAALKLPHSLVGDRREMADILVRRLTAGRAVRRASEEPGGLRPATSARGQSRSEVQRK